MTITEQGRKDAVIPIVTPNERNDKERVEDTLQIAGRRQDFHQNQRILHGHRAALTRHWNVACAASPMSTEDCATSPVDGGGNPLLMSAPRQTDPMSARIVAKRPWLQDIWRWDAKPSLRNAVEVWSRHLVGDTGPVAADRHAACLFFTLIGLAPSARVRGPESEPHA